MRDRKKPVLVLDDDRGLSKSLERLLLQHGYDVIAFDCPETLSTYGNVKNALCLIIDFNLNGASGLDVFHQLRRSGIKTPVIFVTGNDSVANRTAAVDAGCIAYLTKPFPPQALIDSLRKVS